ncbi:MAG: glutathione S-transferase family protein [Gammaproteobacteria bacterium]|nr:glutathione S-transferase family protein [Gammaproteobacteria bacterium]
MFSLYIGNKNYSSWSLRPWLLLTELDIDFEEKLIPFDDGNSWEKFRKFSPTGLVPCLFDGDIQVWESLAIVEYLAEQYSAVWPEDKTARAWARSATAEMHAGFSAIRNQCPMSVGLRIKLHEVSAPLQQDLTRLDELWQQGLDRFGGPFLGGPTFTAVDAFFAPVAYRLQTYALPHAPRAQAYAHHLLSTQGMRAWTDAALKETFREPSHEEEFAQLGVIQKDLRESV